MASLDTDHLADSIDTASTDLIGELKGVRDSVEELYILLDHIWRNREELRDIVAELLEDKIEEREANETVVCCQCHAVESSLAAAVRHGWTDFQCDDDAEDWRYMAVCSGCQRRRIMSAEGRGSAATEQVQQATAGGIADILSTEDVEGDAIPESIACIHCDVDSPPSLAAAVEEGWSRLERDDGSGWNYLGVCPECQAEESAADQARQQKVLFS